MQNDKTYSDIISALVRTKSEANILLAELDVLTRSLYKTGPPDDFNSVMDTQIRTKTADFIRHALIKNTPEKIINDFREEISKLEYLSLTIAFDPNYEIVNHVASWVQRNIGEGIALDISVNKSILGGAVIEYKGRVFTDTLTDKIDKYFLNLNANL
jgi:F0F1-type ATP synthase delta subunit